MNELIISNIDYDNNGTIQMKRGNEKSNNDKFKQKKIQKLNQMNK